MAFSPAVPYVPAPDEEQPRRQPPKRPYGTVAPVKQSERFYVPGRFGDLTAGRLTGILWTLDRGYLEDWADLVEYALTTDDDLQSLYTTAITRVTQATWKVKPNEYGNPADAELAAEFCNEQLGRMRGWRMAQTTLLHALATGYQPMEKEWETDRLTKKNFVRKLHFRHCHRFRLDLQYQYRLYDRGQAVRIKYSPYGQVLDPQRWMVHKHQAIAAYPTHAGLMRAGIWRWVFVRWAEKLYARALEKHGAPYVYGKVQPNTPGSVRDEMLELLEDLHTEKAAVFETGGELVFEAAAAITGTPLYELYLAMAHRSMSKLWLGASDITDPGANGSNAAVNTRAGVATDPRMVAYGIELGETVSDQLFRQCLELNRHLFGGRMAPVPTYEAMTATDEVQTDKQDLIEQSGGSIARGALEGELKTGTPSPAPQVEMSDDDDDALLMTEADQILLAFNPGQDRSQDGKWTDGGGSQSGGGGGPEPRAAGEAPKKKPVAKSALSKPERAEFIKKERDALRSAIDAHTKSPTPESAAAIEDARDALQEKRAAAGSSDPDARAGGGRGAVQRRKLMDAVGNAPDAESRHDAEEAVLEHEAKHGDTDTFADTAIEFHHTNSDPTTIANKIAYDPAEAVDHDSDSKAFTRGVTERIRQEVKESEATLSDRLERAGYSERQISEQVKASKPSTNEVRAAASEAVNSALEDPDFKEEVKKHQAERDEYHSPTKVAERKKAQDDDYNAAKARVEEAKARGEKPSLGDRTAVDIHERRKRKDEEVPMTASDPKALTQSLPSSLPPKRKRSTRKPSSSGQMTLQISSRSQSKLAEVLRGASVDPER